MSNEDKCVLLNKLLKEGFLDHPDYYIINAEVPNEYKNRRFTLHVRTNPSDLDLRLNRRLLLVKVQNRIALHLNIDYPQIIIEYTNDTIDRY